MKNIIKKLTNCCGMFQSGSQIEQEIEAKSKRKMEVVTPEISQIVGENQLGDETRSFNQSQDKSQILKKKSNEIELAIEQFSKTRSQSLLSSTIQEREQNSNLKSQLNSSTELEQQKEQNEQLTQEFKFQWKKGLKSEIIHLKNEQNSPNYKRNAKTPRKTRRKSVDSPLSNDSENKSKLQFAQLEKNKSKQKKNAKKNKNATQQMESIKIKEKQEKQENKNQKQKPIISKTQEQPATQTRKRLTPYERHYETIKEQERKAKEAYENEQKNAPQVKVTNLYRSFNV